MGTAKQGLEGKYEKFMTWKMKENKRKNLESGLTAEDFHLQAINKLEKDKIRKQALREKTVFNNQVAEDQGVKDCNIRGCFFFPFPPSLFSFEVLELQIFPFLLIVISSCKLPLMLCLIADRVEQNWYLICI